MLSNPNASRSQKSEHDTARAMTRPFQPLRAGRTSAKHASRKCSTKKGVTTPASAPYMILKGLDESYKNHIGFAIIRASGEEQ